MYLTGWVSGIIEAEMTSADLVNALDEIRNTGPELYALRIIDELSCTFTVRKKDWNTLVELCEKRENTLKITKKTGLYWWGCRMLRRPVLVTAVCILLGLILYLPTRVLFVRVEGNQVVPENLILEAAEECGIRFGATRKAVRSEQTKNALLSRLESLQWAGVNTSGCVAVLSVREREQTIARDTDHGVSSIVAERDGYIVSCTGTRGSILVQPGQSVKKGQVLISGYTDCGLCVQAQCAQGEVMAVTERRLEAVCPAEYMARGTVRDSEYRISLLLGKKRINLWKGSGISGATCGRMYKEYYITLPGEFRLPFALCIDQYTDNEFEKVTQPQTTVQTQLMEFASCYLSEQMVSGKLLSSEQMVRVTDGGYRLVGQYACMEMIGRERREQNGDIYGKNS